MIYGFKWLYQTLMCLITFSPCSRNWRIVWSFLCSILLFFRMTQKMVLRTHYETLLSFRLYLRWEGITWTTPQQSKALHIADPGLSKQTILFLRTFFYKLYVKKKKASLIHTDTLQFSRRHHQISFAFKCFLWCIILLC